MGDSDSPERRPYQGPAVEAALFHERDGRYFIYPGGRAQTVEVEKGVYLQILEELRTRRAKIGRKFQNRRTFIFLCIISLLLAGVFFGLLASGESEMTIEGRSTVAAAAILILLILFSALNLHAFLSPRFPLWKIGDGRPIRDPLRFVRLGLSAYANPSDVERDPTPKTIPGTFKLILLLGVLFAAMVAFPPHGMIPFFGLPWILVVFIGGIPAGAALLNCGRIVLMHRKFVRDHGREPAVDDIHAMWPGDGQLEASRGAIGETKGKDAG